METYFPIPAKRQVLWIIWNSLSFIRVRVANNFIWFFIFLHFRVLAFLPQMTKHKTLPLTHPLFWLVFVLHSLLLPGVAPKADKLLNKLLSLIIHIKTNPQQLNKKVNLTFKSCYLFVPLIFTPIQHRTTGDHKLVKLHTHILTYIGILCPFPPLALINSDGSNLFKSFPVTMNYH